MGIYIKGVEMPTSCNGCAFNLVGHCMAYKGLYVERKNLEYNSKPEWCPLVSVPKHGDLMDRNALINTLQKLFNKRAREAEFTGNRGACVTWNDAIYHIKSAPTIIEAEDGT